MINACKFAKKIFSSNYSNRFKENNQLRKLGNINFGLIQKVQFCRKFSSSLLSLVDATEIKIIKYLLLVAGYVGAVLRHI